MRDGAKAVVVYVLLGTWFSITAPGFTGIFFWVLDPSIGACRNLSPSSCAFYMYVGVWGMTAVIVWSAYLVLWTLNRFHIGSQAKPSSLLANQENIAWL